MNGCTTVRILLNVVLFVSIITAREITLTGTITDTVFIPGSGEKKPTLSIKPASGLKVKVTAGCANEENDTYFTFTDSNGVFRTIATLPDSCRDKRYDFRAETTLPDSCGFSSSIRIADSASGEITMRHGRIYDEWHGDSVVDNEDTHFFSTRKNVRFHTEGDSVRIIYDLIKIDSIRNDGFNLVLTTSESDTVLDSFFIDRTPTHESFDTLSYWHLQQDCSFVPPKALEKRFPAFAQDRQLYLSLSLSGTDIEFKKTLTILPKDISSLLPTEIVYEHQSQINTIISAVTLNRQGPLLKFTTPTPGIYTIDLFLPNGRLLFRVLDNVSLTAGRYSFPLHPASRRSAQTAMIVRVTGSGVTRTFKMLW